MHAEDCQRRFVTQRLSQRCRIHHIGEQNGPHPGIARISSCAGKDRRSRLVHFNAAEKSVGQFGRLYLNDLVSEHPVSFAMDLGGCFRVWRVAKTENLASFFVDPVFVIMNAVLLLEFDILRMSLGYILCADVPIGKLVNIHVCRHIASLKLKSAG